MQGQTTVQTNRNRSSRAWKDHSCFHIIPAGVLWLHFHVSQFIPGPSPNGPECCCQTVSQVQQDDSPILRSLYLLPIRLTIPFTVLVISYKALHGQAPEYLRDLLHPYIPSMSPRSSAPGLLAVPRPRLKLKLTVPFRWWLRHYGPPSMQTFGRQSL